MVEVVDSQFGSITLGVAPPAVEKRPDERELAREKRSKAQFDAMTASELVDLFEDCGGDINKFTGSFDNRHCGTPEQILARVLFLLNKLGNEVELATWEQLLKAFKSARLLNQERLAFEKIESLKHPDLEKATPAAVTAYLNFWFAELREEHKTRAKKARPVQADPALADLKDLLDQKMQELKREEESR